MKNKIKKWHIVLMSFLILFVAVCASLFSLRADTIDEETGETITDNWELGVVFYDSTVNNGKTALTEIDWDASNGGYSDGTPRVITIQVNYKNNSAVTTYQPGELKIYLNRLMATTNTSFSWGRYLDENKNNFFTYYNVSVLVGANDSTHSGYDWTLNNSDANNWIFSNAKTIEEKSNFEGSIQVQYTITPAYFMSIEYKDTEYCSYTKTINSYIKDKVTSNDITFKYQRTYTYNWQYRQYTLDKAASKISSLDGLPDGNYYWVKYTFTIKGDAYTSYPNIASRDHEIRDVFPSECIVLDSSLNQLTPNNNLYAIKQGYWNSNSVNKIIYVGYPKSIYNENANNLNITNTADLYSKYDDSNEYIYSDNGEVSLNLSNFEFAYTGNLYGITKDFKTSISSSSTVYYDSLIGNDTLIGNGGKGYARLNVSAVYTGRPMDVKFGDDLLYITGSDGNYRKLQDNEYYFSTIAFPGSIINGNDVMIPAEKYDCELWIRCENSNDYIKHEDFKNIANTYNYDKTWTFTQEDKIVGYYFVVKNMTESFKSKYASSSGFSTIVINNAENIAESGGIYNFAYVQVFINGILQNAPGLDSYANFITKEEIATHDMNTYNTYLQRHCNYISYSKYSLTIKPAYLHVKKTMSWNQDSENECFNIISSLALIGTLDADFYSKHELQTYGGSLKDENFVAGWELYDLLPEGFTLTSTPEEIINSATTCIVNSSSYYYSTSIKVYDRNRKIIEPEDFKNLIKENTTVTIIDNYKNSNRTYISIIIDLSDNLILVDHCWGYGKDDPYVSFKINSKITYDDFLEFGSTYKNTVYGFYHNRDLGKNYFYPNRYYYSNSDNGYVEAIANDINQNNNSSESLMLDTNTIVISSLVSTHQDVTKYVKTDQSNYSTGTVDTLNNSEYEYKLRVRTGQNDITNLIIYDVLESAQPNRTRWTGEFLGVDTSFAENRVYKLQDPNNPNADDNGNVSYSVKVNTYTSEDPNAGNLYNEDGTFNNKWTLYYPETLPDLYQNGLEIKFNSQCRTESANYDFIEIYYVLDETTYKLGRWGGTDLAGKTIQVPSTDFYLYWKTDGSVSNYYGFSIDSINPIYTKNTNTTTGVLPSSTIEEIQDNIYPDSAFNNYTHGNYGDNINKIWHYSYTGELLKIQDAVIGTDKTKVKALAFEYVNEDGTPAIIPANNLTYVLIQMKSPADENITTLARNDCRTQWNAIDEYGRPVDFITGINSNVVKVALPNSVDEDSNPSITLKFTKEINGIVSEFENMKLNRADTQTFMIRLTSLTANDDGSYHQVTALLKSNQELIISQIPIGTYLLEELGDNYFDFVEFSDNNDSEIIIEGVAFEGTDQGYIITVSEVLTENIEFNIKVTNEIEPERFYEDKDNKENLFLKNKIEEDE